MASPTHPPAGFLTFFTSEDTYVAWVAEDEGCLVGHVALHSRTYEPAMALASKALDRPPERLGVVARLIVSPLDRRQGIGEALLVSARHEASDRGPCPILDVVTRTSSASESSRTFKPSWPTRTTPGYRPT